MSGQDPFSPHDFLDEQKAVNISDISGGSGWVDELNMTAAGCSNCPSGCDEMHNTFYSLPSGLLSHVSAGRSFEI